MRADFDDTKFLVEMADMMLTPLEQDTEGRLWQPLAVQKQFEEQKRLFHFHRGCRALHTNEPKESLFHLQTFERMLRDEVGEEPHSNDQRMGVCLNEVGNAYFQNGDKDNAEAYFRKSIKYLEVVDGVQPNTVSMPLINLGFVLWQKGELTEAANTFQTALEYRKANYGPDDIVSFALGKLYLGYGNVRKDQGDLDASFDLHKKCLLQYTDSLGPFHHRMGDGSVRLSDHYVRMERYQDAK
jgi:tetratricopeptide (TPR) repeat protein